MKKTDTEFAKFRRTMAKADADLKKEASALKAFKGIGAKKKRRKEEED